MKITLPELPAGLTDCGRPVSLAQSLPAGSVGENRMIELWGRDRATAVSCRNRLLELARFYGDTRAEVGRVAP